MKTIINIIFLGIIIIAGVLIFVYKGEEARRECLRKQHESGQLQEKMIHDEGMQEVVIYDEGKIIVRY